ncbi:MAG TPA: hypothetical protein VFM51_00340 [Solirubrobacterales bacterium]|nr:hypothetical protein [Solirubrobacterales bacterium]
MRYPKMIGLMATAAMIVTALLGADSASATMLEVAGEPKNEKVTITASLKAGTTAVLKSTSGEILNKCTESHIHGNTQSPYKSTLVKGPVTSLSFGNCTKSVTVHDPGELEIHWTSGTNGTVYSQGATITTRVDSPFFEYVTCRTHTTQHLGTLTGTGSGHATLDVLAVLDCGAITSARWEATYTVTSPTGLGSVEGTTTLEVAGEPKNEKVTITGSLKIDSTTSLKNTEDEIGNTCTTSHVHGNTENPYSSTFVSGQITELSFSNCTRAVTVHTAGKLKIHWISGTNGTVSSEEAEVTVNLPFIGYATCTTGSGTHLGTLTGVSSGHATLHVKAVLDCGIIPSAIWEATYIVTSPTGLGSISTPGTTLEVSGEAKNEQVTITASLSSSSSSSLKDTDGFSQNTCTASHVHASTQSPYTGSSVTGPISTLSFSSCTRLVTAHDPGKLEITRTSNTNGMVASEEAEVTVRVPLIGYVTCDTEGTTNIGTLTGTASGHATMDINAVLNCGSIPSAKWEATYTVTSPTGLGVSA